MSVVLHRPTGEVQVNERLDLTRTSIYLLLLILSNFTRILLCLTARVLGQQPRQKEEWEDILIHFLCFLSS